MRKDLKIKRWLLFSLAILVVIVWVFPLVWAISTSLKDINEIIMPGIHVIPQKVTFINYITILRSSTVPLFRWLLNSLLSTSLHVILYLIVSSLAAFAFARLKFKGKEVIFWICLSSMMIPGIINFVPNFLIVDQLGWINTLFPMIFPGLSGVFGVFLLRQFMNSIPKELDEAAKIDGASNFYVYRKIILPLTKPALATLAIFSFQGNWNDFMWPLIVTDVNEMRTLTSGLYIFQGSYNYSYGQLMAGAVISALPVLLIFILLQRYFIQGISLTGVKG